MRQRQGETPQETITRARDSVWVINDTIEKLANNGTVTKEAKGKIQRNVSHLKLVVESEIVLNSGENISDLHDAITLGEAKLAENIWEE